MVINILFQNCDQIDTRKKVLKPRYDRNSSRSTVIIWGGIMAMIKRFFKNKALSFIQQ